MARNPGICKYEEKDYEMVYTLAETRIDSYSLGQLLNDLRLGRIQDDMSMQRDANQWTPKDKSMLMHTVFINLSILPISLIQTGTGGGVVKLLSDGKQRLSNFSQFYNNEFALSSATPHVKMRRIIKQPKLDENGKQIRELIDGKRRVVMEPCLDENGNVITEEVDYKVAGKYFSELPDALKEQFVSYKSMPQYVHINYSDEEIQLQMLRDNTSVKMTPAQIGAVLCGEELAEWQKEFRDHDLFLNNSTWTENQEIKSLIERCITESFVLTMFDNAWNQAYLKNIDTFRQNANKEFLASFTDIVDDFNDIVKDIPELKKYLTKDNLHIILGVFRRFCDFEVRYKKDVFGKFLCEWFETIKDTTEYEVQGNAGTKLKKTVTDKLTIMEEECKKYVEEHGVELSEDEIYEESTSVLNRFIEDFCRVQIPYANKSTALKSLLGFTDYGINNFKEDNLFEFERWIKRNNISSQCYEDCILWAEVFAEKLGNAFAWDKFSEDDIPIMIQIVSEIDDEFDDKDIIEWMYDIPRQTFKMNGESGEILDRKSQFLVGINNYINDRKVDKE